MWSSLALKNGFQEIRQRSITQDHVRLAGSAPRRLPHLVYSFDAEYTETRPQYVRHRSDKRNSRDGYIFATRKNES